MYNWRYYTIKQYLIGNLCLIITRTLHEYLIYSSPCLLLLEINYQLDLSLPMTQWSQYFSDTHYLFPLMLPNKDFVEHSYITLTVDLKIPHLEIYIRLRAT